MRCHTSRAPGIISLSSSEGDISSAQEFPPSTGEREKSAAAPMAAPTTIQTPISFLAMQALCEIHRVFNRMELSKQDPRVPIVQEIMKARHKVIVLHGVGREGLIIQGFAMRLFHLGLRKVHMFGDVCTPLMKAGDLLIVTSGPGWPSSADSIIGEATASGARALVITANKDGAAAALATTVALVPAQTMADPDFPFTPSTDAHPECTMMVQGKTPWQLMHGHRKASLVPLGDPMALVTNPTTKTKLSIKPDDPTKPKSKLSAKPEEIAPPQAKPKLSTKPEDPAPPPVKKLSGKPDETTAAATDAAQRASQRASQAATLRASQLGDPARASQMGLASLRASQVGIVLHPPEPAKLLALDNKILPMGSTYEGALFILFEIVVYTLRETLQASLPRMRARNTNLDHFPPDHACGPTQNVDYETPTPPSTPSTSPPSTPPTSGVLPFTTILCDGEFCTRDHDHAPSSDSGLAHKSSWLLPEPPQVPVRGPQPKFRPI